MSSESPIAVVKYGSSSVTNSRGMDTRRLHSYAHELSDLQHKYDVVVVTSGAVAVGRSILGEKAKDASDQTLATVGSGRSFTAWQLALAQREVHAGQLLVTHHEIVDPEEGSSLRDVMRANAKLGVVSVVNENDALSDIEIAQLRYGGDNDGLAAHIAEVLEARHLCLMTDVPGLLDADGQLVAEVNPDNSEWALRLSEGPVNNIGRGGMRTKVGVSLKAASLGIEAHIGPADLGPLMLIDGQTGTHFPVQ